MVRQPWRAPWHMACAPSEKCWEKLGAWRKHIGAVETTESGTPAAFKRSCENTSGRDLQPPKKPVTTGNLFMLYYNK